MCTYLAKRGATYYFRRTIPAELRPAMDEKAEFMISLRTKDREEAKRRIPALTIRTDGMLDDARKTPKARIGQVGAQAPLSRSELTMRRLAEFEAARDRYEEEGAAFFSAEESEKEHRRELAASAVSFLEGRLKGSTASMPEELRAIAYLREHDVLSRRIAEEQRAIAQSEVSRLTEELASLSQQPAAAPTRKREASVPLLATFEGYANEQQIKPTTRTEWRAVIRRLIAFLGHDDAARVTADDLDRWREALATEPTNRGQLRSARTIRDAYMAAVSATLRWAVEKRRLPENVASKVRVRVPKKAKLRERDFTADEAQAILAATMAPPPARMSAELAFARRWIPWLCAYTGARVNEISQLRKEDVLERDGNMAGALT